MTMQRDLLTGRPFKNRMGLRPPEIPSIKGVIYEVCDRRGVSYPEMIGPRRHGYIVTARQEAMWECAKRTGASLPAIGHVFNRDHTTVLHGIRAHKERMGASCQGQQANGCQSIGRNTSGTPAGSQPSSMERISC